MASLVGGGRVRRRGGLPSSAAGARSLSPISRFDCAGGSLLHRLRLVAPDLPVIQWVEAGRHVSPFIAELRSARASTTTVLDAHDLAARRHVLDPATALCH